MSININNYPIGMLFSGNIYDFRALQFYEVLNRNRIENIFKLTFFQIKNTNIKPNTNKFLKDLGEQLVEKGIELIIGKVFSIYSGSLNTKILEGKVKVNSSGKLDLFEDYNTDNKTQITMIGFDLIDFNIEERNLLCVEDNGDYYLSSDFLQFILDSSNYWKEFNNINSISNPLIKEICFYFYFYSDPNLLDVNLENLIEKSVKFVGNKNDWSKWDDLVDIKIRYMAILEIFESFDLKNLKGYQTFNNNLVEYDFTKISLFKDRNYKYNSSVILSFLYKSGNQGLEIINDQEDLFKSNISGGISLEIDLNTGFQIKNKNLKFFNNNFDFIGASYQITEIILDKYNESNYLDFEKKTQKDELGINFLEKERFYLNRRHGTKDSNFNFLNQKLFFIIKPDNNKFKLIIQQFNEIDIIMNILNNFDVLINDSVDILKKNLETLITKLEIANYPKEAFENIKNLHEIINLPKINYENITNNTEIIKQLSIIKKFINIDFPISNYNRIILNYNKKNYSFIPHDLIDNELFFYSKDIKANDLDKLIYGSLFFFKINENKCYNLQLNLENSYCKDIISDIVLEKGYGPITKNFFKNDNNFKLFDINQITSDTFGPDPDLVLLLLFKLGFRKKNISIFKTKITIIQDYESWTMNDNIDKSLTRNKYLKIYLEFLIIYININIFILNPKYIDIGVLVRSIIKKSEDTDYKVERPRFKYDNKIIKVKILRKIIKESKMNLSDLPVLRRKNNNNIFINKLIQKYKKFNTKNLDNLRFKLDLINKITILK